MAHDGGLPAALQAINRQMALPSSAREADLLASLIHVSGDPQLSKALYALLAYREPEEQTATHSPVGTERIAPPVAEAETPELSDGFGECRRSRDGPR